MNFKLKHRYIFFIILFITAKIFAQERGKIHYRKIQKEGNGQKQSECILFFDKEHSYFLNKMDKAITQPFVDKDGAVVTPSNTIDSIANKPLFVYFDSKNHSFYTNNINNNQEVLIKLDQDKENWVLTKETKTIGGYNCLKALKSSKGKNYIAWYAPRISLPYGPIAINGLEGLILELYTEDGELSFVFEKYEPTKESIDSLIKSYDFKQAISYSEYLELKKSRALEFKKKALENVPVGAKIIENTDCKDCN